MKYRNFKPGEINTNNRLDPVCRLYRSGELIGTVRNHTALLDVLLQIKERYRSDEDTTGYYFRYKRQIVKIEPFGVNKKRSNGFCTYTDVCLDKLFSR